MKQYNVVLSKTAEKELYKLPSQIIVKIIPASIARKQSKTFRM